MRRYSIVNVFEKHKDSYLEYVKSNKDVFAAYLFGSYSDNTYHEKSDIDLGVLYYSEEKEHIDSHLMASVDVERIFGNTRVDYVDLRSANISFRYNVFRNGKLIYCTDEDKLYEYIRKYQDQYIEMSYSRKKYMDYIFREEKEKMNKIKPRTLAGFVELLPQDQIQFNKVQDKVRMSYERFGFVPLDTPILEYSDVLLAKAGGETEKQIYRFTKGDTDLSMRFDLTVPLAKYVAMHAGELAFPFRRYQIGKVFRGERAQKGRFREFYQADIDIIGDEALSRVADAELVSVINTTFRELGFSNFTVIINNRKILNGLFEGLGIKDKATDVLRIIDKIEKVGEDTVVELLEECGIEKEKIAIILKVLKFEGNVSEKLDFLNELNIASDTFKEGIDELREVLDAVKSFGVPDANYTVDFSIARGLDYYTGTVYETVLNDYTELGSVCSGGRYENLAEFYTNKKLPGVGISIGLSRLFYKLEEIGVIKANEATCAKVMVLPMVDDMAYALEVAGVLRQNKINTEVNYTKKSVKSMLNYANRIKVPYVIFVGEDEIKNKRYTIKNMTTGEQEILSIDEIIQKLK